MEQVISPAKSINNKPDSRTAIAATFDKTEWKPITFSEVCRNINIIEKDPLANGIEHYVGLEHIEPNSLHIKSWGSVSDGTTFTKKFTAGQVLFGKRRAYLRKAAVANFDGICSSDILVFQANEDLILPDLFPFLVFSERFFDFAIQTSAGSLSPRTKFQDLAKFEFPLPPKEQQSKLAKLLWAADENIEKHLNLSNNLNQLKSSFQTDKYNHNSFRTIGEIAVKVGSGKTPLGGEKVYTREGVPFLRSQNVLNGKLSLEDIAFIPETIHQSMKSTIVQKGDVLLNITGASIGRSAVFDHPALTEANVNQHVCIIRTKDYSPYILCDYLNSKFGQEQIEVLQTAGNRQGLNFQNLRKLIVPEFTKDDFNMIEQQLLDIIHRQEELDKVVTLLKKLRAALVNQIFN